VAVCLSDSFVIEKLDSAIQLFDEDDDDDCAMVGNTAGESNHIRSCENYIWKEFRIFFKEKTGFCSEF
jgi:hypothetical protein